VGGEDVREQPGPSFAHGRLVVALAELFEQVELIASSGWRLVGGRVEWSSGHDES
jgi:hypothetical protein